MKLSPILRFICPCFLPLLLFSPFSYGAPTPNPESKERQIQSIEKELTREKEQFHKFGKKEKNLLGELSRLEREIAEKKKILDELRDRIERNRMELREGQVRLQGLEGSLREVEERLGRRLVAFYKNAKRGYLGLLATSKDMGQLRKRIKYLKGVMEEDRRLFLEIAAMKREHKRQISGVNEKLAAIDAMEKAESSRLSSLERDLDRKVILLVNIHKEKEFYGTAVKELQLAAGHLKQTVLDLDKDQEPKKVPLPSDFAKSKGRLPLPLKGRIVKQASVLGPGTPNENKGLYIRGPLGAEVKAVFPGRVDYSGWLRGYGQIIILNHGDRYFSISAHLSRRDKEKGDRVKAGEVIGALGQTGPLTKPSLYFELRRGGSNLNAMKWLKVH